MNVWEKVKEYAPTVAAAIATGGAAVPAAAVQILSRELFGRDDQPLERVEFELSKLTRMAENGDTEAAIKLRTLENNHQQKLQEMAYKNVSDARKRDIAIQKQRGRNQRADWMIVLAFLGFIGCLMSLIGLFVKGEPDPGLVGIIATFGTKFLGMIDLSFAFEFGGSADGEKANRNIQALLTRQVARKG